MPVEIYQDATTQDVKRLQSHMNRLALAFQAMQNEVTAEMSERDQKIVTHGSLNMLIVAAERAGKKTSTPRFIRSIRTAMLVARKFGVGRLATQPPAAE